jgi:SAM-dependent methyltransferase
LIYGAGTTLVFRVLLNEGFDVTGSDISHEVVRFREQEFGTDRFIHATELERDHRAYDIITACEVFEHFHDPRRWIGALVRNLAPQGVLCGSTNFSENGRIQDESGYMGLHGHVAYWSRESPSTALHPFGLELELFELVCPGSVKRDLMHGKLWPEKRLFFASRDKDLMAWLRDVKSSTPVLPCDTTDYPIAAYRESL